MLKQNYQKFGSLFLHKFTQELIKNYKKNYLIEEVKIPKKFEFKQVPRSPIIPLKKNSFQKVKEFLIPRGINAEKTPRVLIIPETKLPPQLQYLKPLPLNKEIDLGKLNQFIKNPAIKTVECNGPNEKIIITTPTRKTTEVTLSKKEINEVIDKFSKAAKIPPNEGIFEIAFGKLMLSAIISEVIGSKFIIKKIFPKPNFPQRIPLRGNFKPLPEKYKFGQRLKINPKRDKIIF